MKWKRIYLNYPNMVLSHLRLISQALLLRNLLILGEEEDHNPTSGQNEIAKPAIPLIHDSMFNLLICSECHIAVPHDWVIAHLKKNHGISKRLEDIDDLLSLQERCISSVEAKNWLDSIWVISKPIIHIPVVSGYHCVSCNYCCQEEKVLKKHFQRQHNEVSWKDQHEKCMVQQPFKGRLSKYLLIESSESVDAPSDIIPDWKGQMEQEFWDSMRYKIQLHEGAEFDPRLSSAFIAKTRFFDCILY